MKIGIIGAGNGAHTAHSTYKRPTRARCPR
jgi:hypothetical protein